MAWDYDYTVRVGGGSHVSLSTWCDAVRMLPEVSPAPRNVLYAHSYRHGVTTPSRSWFKPRTLMIECFVSYGPTPVTHTDGAAGHVYENRSDLLTAFQSNTETVWLGRTAPHQGDVEIPVVVTRQPTTSNPRNKIVLALTTLDPFWRDQSQSTDTITGADTVTVGGDAPVGDCIVECGAAGDSVTLTHTASGASIIAAGLATTLTVDCGERTFTQSTNPADDQVTWNHPELLELQPGANAFTLTGTSPTVTFKWYDKWL